MTTVTLRKLEVIDNPTRQIEEWGDRLFSCYRLNVDLDGEQYQFTWVMAGSKPHELCPEYDDDFDEFLVKVCRGATFKKCRPFINEIQERFSLALHYAHSRDKSIEVQLPIVVSWSGI